MLFCSPTFLFAFLPVTIALYYLSGRAASVLLAASLVFYAWGEPAFVFLLVASSLLNFVAGCAIGRARGSVAATFMCSAVIVLNLAPLVFFKYSAFLFSIFTGKPLESATYLPLAISFYTFHAISYLVDVYRGDVRPESSALRFCTYMAMFPHLIAGPIVRFRHIEKELRAPDANWENFAAGVERFAIGLAKKVLIADTLATPTDQIFAISNHAMPMSLSIFGVVLFSLQIYFDFSGYSDMAIGLARIFGYRFHENFDRPYSARSIREFWRRWHISLSTWFRDYVYRPLGGNRRDGARTIANLVTVFLLCGFWHGASWTFIVWGAYHGAFLAIERTPFGRLLAQLPGWMQRAYTLAVVAVGWAIFRAADLDQAAAVLGAMFGAAPWANPMYPVQLYSDPFLLLILAVASMIALGVRPKPGGALLLSPVRLATMPLLLAISAAAVAASTHKAFIYFRF